MTGNKTLHLVTWVLLVIGGLNWLLFGLLGWDISMLLGGMGSLLSRAIYVLVGLSAIYEIVTHKSHCKLCGTSSGAM